MCFEINMDNYKKQIEIITSSEWYEGNYGHDVDITNIPEKFRNTGFLVGYINFLASFGHGELDASFYVEEAPLEWNEIFPKERSHLDGLFIFATDQGEYCYGFDSNSDFKVVEIAADGEVSESSLGSFDQFITNKLNELVDIVNWRDDNL